MNRGANNKHHPALKDSDPILELIERWKKRAIATFTFASLLLALGFAFTVELQHTLLGHTHANSVTQATRVLADDTVYHYTIVLTTGTIEGMGQSQICQTRPAPTTDGSVRQLLAEQGDPVGAEVILVWLESQRNLYEHNGPGARRGDSRIWCWRGTQPIASSGLVNLPGEWIARLEGKGTSVLTMPFRVTR